MLEDKDMECLFGDTPEELNNFLRKGQVKETVEEVTVVLVECKQENTWEHTCQLSLLSLSTNSSRNFSTVYGSCGSKETFAEHKGVS